MASKKGRLAPEAMTMEALWALVAKEMVWLRDHGIRGAAFADRKRNCDKLDACLQELAGRGFQMALGCDYDEVLTSRLEELRK